ncbi:MAG: serine--tRNA ligase, partial [Aureliella sp.]
MLDRKFIVENAEAVKQNCLARGTHAEVDRLVELEMVRRTKLIDAQELNRQANETSKLIGKAGSEQERESLKEQGRQLREQKDRAQVEHDQLESQIHELQAHIPNATHPDAPIGSDDTANTQISVGKTPIRKFDFKAKDHVELGKSLDLIMP